MDNARPRRGADCDRSGDADLHAAVAVLLLLLVLPLILPPPGEERIERGVITIDDDCFCDVAAVDETNVSSDSVDGPNSGLIDVVALRIRVRMEMLSSPVMICCCFVAVGSNYGSNDCSVVKNYISDAPSPSLAV